MGLKKKTLVADKEKEVRDILVGLEDCVRGYLAADSVPTMLPFIRHPDRVALLMGDYYKSHRKRGSKFQGIELQRVVSVGAGSFAYVMVATESGASRHLLLEQIDATTFKVDWECDVFYQPMPWREYLLKRPVRPMDMRVKVESDCFYGFAFRDAKRYQCYKLTSLDSDDYLFGYVERGSQVAKRIEELVSQSGVPFGVEQTAHVDLKDDDVLMNEEWDILLAEEMDITLEEDVVESKSKQAILRVRFLREDASMRCVQIDDLLSDNWLYLVSPEASP